MEHRLLIIYEMNANGQIVSNFAGQPVIATGFFQGLTWDGSFLWSGDSSSTGLKRFDTSGNVQLSFTNLWPTFGISDVSFDANNNQLLVFRNNGLTIVNPLTGSVTQTTFTVTYTVGDLDCTVSWAANNTTQKIEVIFLRDLIKKISRRQGASDDANNVIV